MRIAFKFDIIPIEKLTPDSQNARVHGNENLESIKQSLTEFGFQQAIVVSKDFEIYAGNARYLAAKELGFKEIPCAISDLSIDKLRAYAIADNNIPLLASWDLPKLSQQIQDLSVWNENLNWQSLGFNDNQLKLMLSFDENIKPEANSEDFRDSNKNNSSSAATNTTETTKVKYKPLKINDDQRQTIQRAIEKVREQEGDKSMPEGQCLELIAAEYLS